jgi:hypothetical protein
MASEHSKENSFTGNKISVNIFPAYFTAFISSIINSQWYHGTMPQQPEKNTHDNELRMALHLAEGDRDRLLKEYGIQGRLGNVYQLATQYMDLRQQRGKRCFPIEDNGLYSGEGALALYNYALPFALAEGYLGPVLSGIDNDDKSLRMSRLTLREAMESGAVQILKMDATEIIPAAFPEKFAFVTCIEVLGVGLDATEPDAIERLFAGIDAITLDDATVFITFLNQAYDSRTRAHSTWESNLKGVSLGFKYMDGIAAKHFPHRDWYGQMISTYLGPRDPATGNPGGTAWPYNNMESDPARFYEPDAFTPVPFHEMDRHRQKPEYWIGAFSRDPQNLFHPNSHL